MSDNNYSKDQHQPPLQRPHYNRSYNSKEGNNNYQQPYSNQQMHPNMGYPYPPYPLMHYGSYPPPQQSQSQQPFNNQIPYNNYYYQQHPQQYQRYSQQQYPPYPQYRQQNSKSYSQQQQGYSPDKRKQNHPQSQQYQNDKRKDISKKDYNQPKQRNSYNYSPHSQKNREQFSQVPRQQERQDRRPWGSRDNRRKQDDQHSENEEIDHYSAQLSEQEESQEEQIFYKRKFIQKKKDPVHDSRQEIRKWIEARKKNYPRANTKPEDQQRRIQFSQMSVLEKKIRKKILLITADSRGILKKAKDIDILRRYILNPRRARRNFQPNHRVEQVKRQIVAEPSEVPVLIEQIRQQLPLPIEDLKPIAQPASNQINDVQQQAIQVPIKSDQVIPIIQAEQKKPYDQSYSRKQQLSVDVIIKHLQMKQSEDTKVLQNLMDYKTNSFNYRYQYKTLETNLLIDSIFNETLYALQAIRFIVKNNFFQENQ